MIVCIATKNRFNTSTYKLFESAGYIVYHFVEPQDYERYNVPNKVNILKNNQGLMYVRNFILNYAKKNGYNWFLMCDDDVTQFGKAIGTKCHIKEASIFNEILNYAEKLPFEIVALNYRQHAWSAKKKYSINNAFADVCVLMNAQKIKWDFESDIPLKGDREFCLKAIKYGNGVLKFEKYFFNTPAIGKNQGGLYDIYKQNKDIEDVEKIVKMYYPYAKKILNNLKRIDFKFDFKQYCKDLKKVNK